MRTAIEEFSLGSVLVNTEVNIRKVGGNRKLG
jgi:hypothetical protein